MDRILGCVMAGAVADAVGYQVEFSSLQEILASRPGGVAGPLSGMPLLASDDTQMTLFTMRGLSLACSGGVTSFETEEARLQARGYIRAQLLAWLATQGTGPAPTAGNGLECLDVLRRRRAPGNTCLQSLGQGGWGTPELAINDSKGCGAVMRSAPVGLLPGISAGAAYRLGCLTGASTHGHVDGWAPAGAMAAMVAALVSGASMLDAATYSAAMMPLGSTSRALLLNALAFHRDGSRLEERSMTDVLGTGWTGDSALALGVHAALSGSSYEDAVRIASTHDGDSDSTASIAGQLLGARDGVDIVPSAWIEAMDLSSVVQDECRRFHSATGIVHPQLLLQEGEQDTSRLGSIMDALRSMTGMPRRI